VGTIYGESYTGYNEWRLIKRVQFMEKKFVQCTETHIDISMYGDLYSECNVWRLIYRLQCLATHIDGTI